MKRKNLIFVSILIIMILLGILFVLNNKKNESKIFQVNFYQDTTSSGGTRHYNSSLVFQGDKLISGYEIYETWPGTGGHNIINCIINQSFENWVDNQTMKECEYTSSIPLNKDEIIERMNSEEFKSIDKCTHFDICYKIIN